MAQRRARGAPPLALLLALAPLAPAHAQGKPEAPGGGEADEVARLIDNALAASWKANKITPAVRCTDDEFLRRASLDIIGRIATRAEVEEFSRDARAVPSAVRRRNLVERLLKSEEYAKNWANLWATWLLTRSGAFGRGPYHDQTVAWLEEQFALNRPPALPSFAGGLPGAPLVIK